MSEKPFHLSWNDKVKDMFLLWNIFTLLISGVISPCQSQGHSKKHLNTQQREILKYHDLLGSDQPAEGCAGESLAVSH